MRAKHLLIIFPVAAVMLLGASCTQQPIGEQKPVNQPAVNAENKNVNQPAVNEPVEEGLSAEADAEWLTYSDPQGRFEFNYPSSLFYYSSADWNSVFISSTPAHTEAAAPTPNITIEVSDTSVKLSVGENTTADYFKGVVGSFRFPGHQAESGWKTYNDPNGKYFFQHPDYAVPGANKDGSSIEMHSRDGATGELFEVPDMTIKVSDKSVIFAVWENFDVEYFRGLVSSFKYR